jgi:undecaprenyl diphosphate synthase
VADKKPHIPRHIAIVMDGNGRWANKRFMPRLVGHKFGVDALIRLIDICADRGVEYLTVFAFSSENWKRPQEEVSHLMSLGLQAATRYLAQVAQQGVRVRIIGDRTAVSPQLRAAWDKAEAQTAHNTRISLSVAFNYGGRWDVVQACKRAMEAGVPPAELTEQRLHEFTCLGFAPDPDLFIRTGGELRISNFLLWQLAYAELYFTDCLWPDFGATELDAAIAAYARRDRRFGAVNDVPAAPAQAAQREPQATAR